MAVGGGGSCALLQTGLMMPQCCPSCDVKDEETAAAVTPSLIHWMPEIGAKSS